MKLRCRCGELVKPDEPEGRTVATCSSCGRAYRLQRGSDGQWRASPLAAEAAGGARPAAKQEWPDELELEAPASPLESASSGPAGGGMEGARPEKGEGGTVPAPPHGPAEPAAHAAGRSWWHYLLEAWTYPFRGETWKTFLLWSAAWALLPWITLLLLIPLLQAIAGLLIILALAGMFVLYQFEIIRQSAWEAPNPPRLPQFDDMWESGIRPLCMVGGAMLGAFAPWLLGAAPALFWNAPHWWPTLLDVLLVLSLYLVPINLLAVAMADNALAINPRFTLTAVARIPGPYTVCAVLALALAVLSRGVGRLLARTGPYNILAPFASAMVLLYLCSVFSRALGTLHYVYEDRIGWMREVG